MDPNASSGSSGSGCPGSSPFMVRVSLISSAGGLIAPVFYILTRSPREEGLMSEYRYVVVSQDGRSWLLQGDEEYNANVDQNSVLPQLLNDGWKPLRERTLGEGGGALILLRRRDPSSLGDDIPF